MLTVFPAQETESAHPLHLFQNLRAIFSLEVTVEALTTVIMDGICAILTMEIADFAKIVFISGIFNYDSMRNENKIISQNI